MIKVSIIIPIYNMERYLKECLDSISKQTLQEIEILCIDDGSTDSSPVLLEEYKKQDSRIKMIRQNNQGVSVARNKGIEAAEGKYVIFMDPDDWYPSENILEDLYNAAETYQVRIAGGSFMDYHDGIYNEEFIERYFGYRFEKEGIIEYTDYQFDFGYQRFLFERQLLVENRIFFKEYKRFQDPPFMVEAMIKAERFYGMNKPSYCYRYGHTEIRWNKEKVCDLLKGISDNLDISKKYGLKKLHNLTVTRLNEEYRQLLGDSIFYEDYAADVAESMLEVLQHVDSEMLEEDKGSVVQIYHPVLSRIKEDIRMHVDRIEDLEYRNKLLEEEKQEIIRKSEEEKQELNRLTQEVYQSLSYRVGHAVTILPRFLARLVRK